MNKFLKWGLIIIGVGAFFMIASTLLKSNTKSHSPQELVTFNYGTTEASVYYSKPYKKNRAIFGELVPFGEVWRTGANEPTTFKINGLLNIDGKTLPAGEYSLWTIPNTDSWEIIWNSEIPGWGVSAFNGKAQRNSEYDALIVTVPVEDLPSVQEQFTIELNEEAISLSWDQTKVSVQIR